MRVLGKGGKEREVPVGRYGREAVDAYLDAGTPVVRRPVAAAARCS